MELFWWGIILGIVLIIIGVILALLRAFKAAAIIGLSGVVTILVTWLITDILTSKLGQAILGVGFFVFMVGALLFYPRDRMRKKSRSRGGRRR